MAYGARFWKFTAGHTGGRVFWEDFRRNKRIVLGHFDANLSVLRTHEDLEKVCLKMGNRSKQFHDFFDLKKGDLVACYLSPTIVGLGHIGTNKYHYLRKSIHPKYHYHHARDVVWLKDFPPQDLTKCRKFVRKEISGEQITLHEINDRRVIGILQRWRDNYLNSHPKEMKSVPKPGPSDLLTSGTPRRGHVLSTSTIDESATWGMERATVYEKSKGRNPRDVSMNLVHYDLESKDSMGKVVRYIEVKARKSSIPVTLTDKEYEEAGKKGKDYWLYVITDDATGFAIRDPVKNCKPKPTLLKVWVVKDWQKKRTRFNIPTPAGKTSESLA
jgi:hypothetical protein